MNHTVNESDVEVRIIATFKSERWELTAMGREGARLLAAVIMRMGEQVRYEKGVASVSYRQGGFLPECVNAAAKELGLKNWRTRFE
jgi:hypothetical protein